MKSNEKKVLFAIVGSLLLQASITHTAEYTLSKLIRNNEIELVKNFVDRGENANRIADSVHEGYSAAQLAILMNRIEILQILLDAGVDPNAHPCGKAPLLHITLFRLTKLDYSDFINAGSIEKEKGTDRNIAEMLVRAGAKIDRSVVKLLRSAKEDELLERLLTIREAQLDKAQKREAMREAGYDLPEDLWGIIMKQRTQGQKIPSMLE